MDAEGWSGEILKSRKLAVMRVLKHTKMSRAFLSVQLMKEFIDRVEAEGSLWPETREALRWFVIEARRRAIPNAQAGGKWDVADSAGRSRESVAGGGGGGGR